MSGCYFFGDDENRESVSLLRVLSKRMDIVDPVLEYAAKALNSFIRLLCSPSETLSVKTEAAIAVQRIIKSHDEARDLLLPFLKNTVVNVLEIAAETKVGGVANAMEELLEHFEDTVVPIVVEFIDEKVNPILELIDGRDENGDVYDTLTSFTPMITNVVYVVMAAIYKYRSRTIYVCHQMHPFLLDHVYDQFLLVYHDIKGLHNRMLALVGICEFMNLPYELRPYVMDDNPEKKANVEEFKTRFDEYGIPEVFVYIKNTLTQFEQNEPELYATMTSKLSSQESESLHNLMQASACDEAYANFEHPRHFDQDGDDDVDEYKALAVNDGWAGLVVFLLGDPHLLEGGQGGEDGSSDPDGVLALDLLTNII
ncbi:unnamed protein product [Heligmosomoides polygyrus]|uniref:Importin subunit beta-1 n=1 Tax=Heligmosomoides polygyrus TaxID=6339 RepID=A0A183FH56_HELPZ|nr:unnamed protein product [Heligmosomoides polygyrus]